MARSELNHNWDHCGKTRQQRGYGAAHDRMRKHLMQTVIMCEHCSAKGRATVGTHADHIIPKAKGGSDERGEISTLLWTIVDAFHDEPIGHQAARLHEELAVF